MVQIDMRIGWQVGQGCRWVEQQGGSGLSATAGGTGGTGLSVGGAARWSRAKNARALFNEKQSIDREGYSISR